MSFCPAQGMEARALLGNGCEDVGEVFRRLREVVEPCDHHDVAGFELSKHIGKLKRGTRSSRGEPTERPPPTTD
jgi:hypothetical protein